MVRHSLDSILNGVEFVAVVRNSVHDALKCSNLIVELAVLGLNERVESLELFLIIRQCLDGCLDGCELSGIVRQTLDGCHESVAFLFECEGLSLHGVLDKSQLAFQ